MKNVDTKNKLSTIQTYKTIDTMHQHNTLPWEVRLKRRKGTKERDEEEELILKIAHTIYEITQK